MRKSASVCVFAVLFAVAAASNATADTLTMQFNHVFSGAVPPAGAAPWITAAFDSAAAGTVDLKISSNLTASEFIRNLYFNLSPITPLTFAVVAGGTTAGFTLPTISQGADAFKADGDGFFDIFLEFATAPPGDRFSAGETLEYTITGAGITASSFNSLSTNSSQHLLAASHIQAIGRYDDSAWIDAVVVVPEAANVVSLAVMALAVGVFNVRGVWRRRHAKT